MATNRLTDTKCKQAAAKVVGGERRPTKIYDGEGLFLYCTAAGAKVWRLDYRDEGRPQTETFGPYPLLSLADARQKRIDFKKALLNGPPAEPAAAKTSKEEITFRQAWTDYLTYRSTDLSVGVRENFRRGLEMHVEPFLGDRLLREITDADMRSVLLRLDAAGKLSYVRKVRKWCGQVFAWAKPRGYCDAIPTREIDPKLEFRKKKEVHYPSLPLPEVHEFMGRLALERPELQSVLACQLLALTWVRTTNLRSMEWAEIDGDIWRIPATMIVAPQSGASEAELPNVPVCAESQGMSIDSFKSVHDRCIEVGECWIWVGRLNPANYPMASHQGVNVLVRRRVFEMTNDWVPDGRGTVVAATCNERACCNPEHLRAASRSSVFKAAAKRVNQQATYGRRLAAKVNSPGGVKLSLAIAREIRADERNCVQIARTLGVSASAVQKIRQGKIWRETANGASVFGWRPAA